MCGLLWFGTGALVAQAPMSLPDAPPPVERADPQIAAALAGIAPDHIEADIAKLVSFGTRQTLSSMRTDLPPGQGRAQDGE